MLFCLQSRLFFGSHTFYLFRLISFFLPFYFHFSFSIYLSSYVCLYLISRHLQECHFFYYAYLQFFIGFYIIKTMIFLQAFPLIYPCNSFSKATTLLALQFSFNIILNTQNHNFFYSLIVY
jgi:hypothetical protein